MVTNSVLFVSLCNSLIRLFGSSGNLYIFLQVRKGTGLIAQVHDVYTVGYNKNNKAFVIYVILCNE